jgi:hypothetical protein
MYDEMDFHEGLNDLVENITMVDTFSDSDSNTSNEISRKQKKMLEEIKKMDKGYHKIKITLNNKKKSIELYSTSIFPGSKIRGAIGGSYYSGFKVGSRDEDLFFKIACSTGDCKDNNICFFDTPEQFENHMHTSIDQSVKEKWYEKFNNERISRQST